MKIEGLRTYWHPRDSIYFAWFTFFQPRRNPCRNLCRSFTIQDRIARDFLRKRLLERRVRSLENHTCNSSAQGCRLPVSLLSLVRITTKLVSMPWAAALAHKMFRRRRWLSWALVCASFPRFLRLPRCLRLPAPRLVLLASSFFSHLLPSVQNI